MRERVGFWLRALAHGVRPLDTLARWIAVAVLLLGIAGVTVTFVFHLPWPLVVVILMGILLAVMFEGAYRVWHATDQARVSAERERDAAQAAVSASPAPGSQVPDPGVAVPDVPRPPLVVTILDDSRFENWQYIAMIAELHVQVENTTGQDIRVAGYGFTYDNGGPPLWDQAAGADERLSVEREIHRRTERQEPGQPIRHYSRISARSSVSGWLLTAVTRNPAGGTPECVVIVTDDIGNGYRAVLPPQQPQTYGS